MDTLIKIPIILVLCVIVFSLVQGMYYLAKDDGKSDRKRLVKALTVRIVLSFVLFAILIIGYLSGVVEPHRL